jgi:hypothetical protein
MANEYGRFDANYAAEREKSEIYEKELNDLKEVYDEVKIQTKRQRLEIIDYEQRYKGIDIMKLHE